MEDTVQPTTAEREPAAAEATGQPDPAWLALLDRGRRGGEDGASAICDAYSRGIRVGMDRATAAEREPQYTAAVESRWGLIGRGWFVHTEVVYSDHRDFEWQLIEHVDPCTRSECPVAGGVPEACVVVSIQGRGILHRRVDWPVSVRIPATTVVKA